MEHYAIPESHQKALYKLADDVSKVLEKHKIDYFIDGSTLLGAVRHRGLIPWNDDVDFGIFSEQENMLHAIQQDIENFGYRVEFDAFCTHISVPNKWILHKSGRAVATPTLNIFVYEICEIIDDNNETHKWIMPFHPRAKAWWPESKYRNAEMFPLKKYKFGIVELWGCNDPARYLDGMYPDWKSKAIIDVRTQDNPITLYFKGFSRTFDFVPHETRTDTN